jgi:hypothetical protein
MLGHQLSWSYILKKKKELTILSNKEAKHPDQTSIHGKLPTHLKKGHTYAYRTP